MANISVHLLLDFQGRFIRIAWEKSNPEQWCKTWLQVVDTLQIMKIFSKRSESVTDEIATTEIKQKVLKNTYK